jgi:hypothetical protein
VSTTITTERQDTTAKVPEWRRICHRYYDDAEISVCGTARRKAGEDHFEDECRARGHTVCVICEEFVAAMGSAR